MKSRSSRYNIFFGTHLIDLHSSKGALACSIGAQQEASIRVVASPLDGRKVKLLAQGMRPRSKRHKGSVHDLMVFMPA